MYNNFDIKLRQLFFWIILCLFKVNLIGNIKKTRYVYITLTKS